MGTFHYKLPSGAKFVMTAPAGTTQAQADLVFYTQVASGSLVGYATGQTMSSPSTRLTQFELSREQRDTAGVPDSTILSIITGSDIVAPVPILKNIPLVNPIDSAYYAQANTPLGVEPVGPLPSPVVQGLLAQMANVVDQPSNAVSTTAGVGTYGLKVPQLQRAGYLKPGTSNYPDYQCVVSTPSVWTGKNGINSLTDVVSDPLVQTQLANQVFQNSYDSLIAAGTIQNNGGTPASNSSAQIYVSDGKGGGSLQTASAVALAGGTAALVGQLSGLTGIITAAVKDGAPATLANLLPKPITELSTLASGAISSAQAAVSSATAGVSTLASTIGGLSSTAQSAFSNLTSGNFATLANTNLTSLTGQFTGVASSLTTTLAGDVGALITNASQFGTSLTGLWAGTTDLSGLGNSLLGSAQGALNGITAGLTGGLQSAAASLTGTASSLASSIGGISDSITASIGSLTDSAALGDLTNLAQTGLGQLSELASGALGSLTTSLNNFGSMAQFGAAFSLLSSDSLVSAVKPAAGYLNTVNRQTVDAAMNRIIGNNRIISPTFEYPSAGATGSATDVLFAQNQLQQLTASATNIASQVSKSAQDIQALGRKLTPL